MVTVRLVNPARKKTFTPEEVERRQAQAVQFTRNVVGDPDLADEIEGLSVEEYAARKGFQLANLHNGEEVKNRMAHQTEEKLEELGAKIDALLEAIRERGAKASNPRSNPAQRNPNTSTFGRLSPRAKERLRAERDEILAALEEAHDALDGCRYDEAQQILDDILDQYEFEEEP
ncbi:MAG: hypothetical protein HY237_03065 [Acidobacteria bacterium]|nr:hypothetical protein [Acidobacteriota bacterium]